MGSWAFEIASLDNHDFEHTCDSNDIKLTCAHMNTTLRKNGYSLTEFLLKTGHFNIG